MLLPVVVVVVVVVLVVVAVLAIVVVVEIAGELPRVLEKRFARGQKGRCESSGKTGAHASVFALLLKPCSGQSRS